MNELSCGKHKEKIRKNVLLKCTKIVISEEICDKYLDIEEMRIILKNA